MTYLLHIHKYFTWEAGLVDVLLEIISTTTGLMLSSLISAIHDLLTHLN
jgi:hypothetical protein